MLFEFGEYKALSMSVLNAGWQRIVRMTPNTAGDESRTIPGIRMSAAASELRTIWCS